MLKELPPIALPPKNFWSSILSNLADNKDSLLPVIMQDSETKEEVGKFYASAVKEDQRVYLQIENVTGGLGEWILSQGMDDGWQLVVGGGYRIPITDLLIYT